MKGRVSTMQKNKPGVTNGYANTKAAKRRFYFTITPEFLEMSKSPCKHGICLTARNAEPHNPFGCLFALALIQAVKDQSSRPIYDVRVKVLKTRVRITIVYFNGNFAPTFVYTPNTDMQKAILTYDLKYKKEGVKDWSHVSPGEYWLDPIPEKKIVTERETARKRRKAGKYMHDGPSKDRKVKDPRSVAFREVLKALNTEWSKAKRKKK
jgi:hypothetical protein